MYLYSKNYTAVLTIVVLLLALTSCASKPISMEAEQGSPFKSSYSLENRLQLANTAYAEGRLVDAEKLLLNIVFEHRNLTDAWFKLGNIYYRSGRYKAAVNAYETVLKHDSDYERAWYNMALARISQSVEALDMAIINLPQESPLNVRAQRLKERYAGGMRKRRKVEVSATGDAIGVGQMDRSDTKVARLKPTDSTQISHGGSLPDADGLSEQ